MDIVDALNTTVAQGSSHLDLSGLGLDDQQLKALVDQPALSKIRELNLSNNRIRPAGAHAIAGSRYLANLACLDLSNNRVLTDGAGALAQSPHLSSLNTLHLGDNYIQDNGVVSIAASPYFTRLQVLGLARNGLSAVAARALGDSPYIRWLLVLNLAENDIGPDGALCLASSVNCAQLQNLSLSSNSIGDAGCRSLMASLFLVSLNRLDLSYNNITQDGATAIADSANLVRVSRLCLLGNAIGNEGVDILSRRSCHFPSLETLNIASNEVTIVPERLFEFTALKRVRSGGNVIENLPAEYLDDTVDNVKRYLSDRRTVAPGNVSSALRVATVFISYSHQDEAYRSELEVHLAMLKRQGLVAIWNDHCIAPGGDIDGGIRQALDAATVILLLVSPDFLASDYCYSKELSAAMTRQQAGLVTVLPVILRPCDWRHTPFAHLKATPRDGRPISSFTSHDEAMLSVTSDIRRLVQE